MIESGYAALDFLLCISLQKHRRFPKADAQHHRIIIIYGLGTDELVAWGEQHADRSSTQPELVALPMAYDFDAKALRSRDHVLEGLTWRLQA